MALSCILLLVVVSSFAESSSASQPNSTSPVIISPAVLSGGDVGVCPSLDSLRQTVRDEIATALQDITSSGMSNCPCGGSGQWTNIADFNFSDPDVACPSGFTLITEPVRGCGRAPAEAADCKSVIFLSGGQSYSHVCGRVNGYQKGSTDAFDRGFRTLEQDYVDGVSLTHGARGSRQHIWTFVAAILETSPSYNPHTNCACTNTEEEWLHNTVPSYVGNNYFCATGNPGPEWDRTTLYADDPLWDGEGCGATNACCEFNNPPWFCTTLPQPTTDNIEMRVCSDEVATNEDVILSFASINIM